MLDVTSLLEEIKASPFEEQEIVAPHTGVVTFGSLKLGDKVIGPNGTWKERPGTLIATITRERNPKPLNAVQKGEVCAIHSELEGTYVQAGTPLATIRHFLSKDEVLRILLKRFIISCTRLARERFAVSIISFPRSTPRSRCRAAVPSPSTKAWNSSSFPG